MNQPQKVVGERTNGWSLAFGGGLLWGDLPVRFLFVDEAGTSAKEPVTVVVALIAEADSHVMNAEALALETLGGLPPQHREGFVFHAAQIFGDRRYQLDWSMTDRLRLLTDMMSIPRRIGMAITVSAVWRNAPHSEKTPLLPKHQLQHVIAFANCLAVADRSIRRHAGVREVGTVVAEDIPEMRRFLREVPRTMHERPQYISPDMLRETEKDRKAGYNTQSSDLRISRIRNSVHFVDKSEDPLVQIADACAYGFRRFFSRQKFGRDFVDSIIGNHELASHFGPPAGVECWWPMTK